MSVNGAVIHAGVPRNLAQTKRFDAVCLEARNRSLNEGLRQATVAKGLSRFLPPHRHIVYSAQRMAAIP
jgi:hypothetical protein